MSTTYSSIPIIPESILSKKYEVTQGFLMDPDSIKNSQMDALRYTGTDKPLFEEEQKKDTRMDAMNRINLMQFGSRYTHAPDHSELFLGETFKDPRGTKIDPDMSKVADAQAFRYKNYYSFVNDDTNNIVEGVIPERAMIEKRMAGFYDTQSRLPLFEDSQDTLLRGVKVNKKPIDVFNGTEREKQKYYNGTFELINPQRQTNRANQLSNQFGNEWRSVPDNRFAVSSYTNLYRTKADVDNSISKVFQMSQPQHKKENEKYSTVKESLMQLMDNVKKSKELDYSVNVTLNKDSQSNAFTNANKERIYNKGGAEINNVELTQKKAALENYLDNRFNRESNSEGVYNNRMQQEVDIKKSKLQSELNNISMGIPQNKNLYYETIQERKKMGNDKENLVAHITPGMIRKIKQNNRPDPVEEANRSKFQSLINETYQQSLMKPKESYLTNVASDDKKSAMIKEIILRNSKTVNNVVTGQLGDSQFETSATTDNKTFNQSIGPMGSKYLRNQQEFDIEVNPINELTTYRPIVA